MERTTQQRIVELLRKRDAAPSTISEELRKPEKEVYNHLEALQRVFRERDETLMIAPPECRNCGFSDFTESINPSRCPECRSERLTEPVFRIQ